jgi:hypothetical protein
MSLGGLCEIWSLYMKQKMRYAKQTAFLSFLMNLFSANISPYTLGTVFKGLHIL